MDIPPNTIGGPIKSLPLLVNDPFNILNICQLFPANIWDPSQGHYKWIGSDQQDIRATMLLTRSGFEITFKIMKNNKLTAFVGQFLLKLIETKVICVVSHCIKVL